MAIEGTFSSSSPVNTKNKTAIKIHTPPIRANLGNLDSSSNLADTFDISVCGSPCEVIQ